MRTTNLYKLHLVFVETIVDDSIQFLFRQSCHAVIITFNDFMLSCHAVMITFNDWMLSCNVAMIVLND